MIMWISILYSPTFCDTLSFSAGLWRSFTPAATRHHFISGAQKNTVLGPIVHNQGERGDHRIPDAWKVSFGVRREDQRSVR